MSSFTFEQENELRRLFERWGDDSRQATLIRQLQGGAVASAISETVTVTWPGDSTLSSFATVVHNFGSVARVIALPQDQSGSGGSFPVITSVTVNSFAIAAQTPSFVPAGGTTRDITVLYWEQ